ncbi:MAG: cyclic nucleotide-binding domain-containing protein [Desulfamplus sp.]|nr:cyclic nucleotide-binding domain-containing protein [Desulfamplus sp.]
MAKNIKKNFINDATIELLSKFEILKNLAKDELRKLLRADETDYDIGIAKLIRYQPNEIVIREGDFDSWTFWIVKGNYKVIVGDSVITTISTPGDIFGEMSVLEGLPRTASVISMEEGICLGIDMSILGNINDDYIIHVITMGFKQKRLERINTTRTQLIQEKQDLDLKYVAMLKFEQKLKKQETEFVREKDSLAKREAEVARREAEVVMREAEMAMKEAEMIMRENKLSLKESAEMLNNNNGISRKLL